MCDPQVYANILITDGQGVGFADLTAKHRVPVLSLSLHGECFDGSWYVPMQMQAHSPKLREVEFHFHHALVVWRAPHGIQFPACPIGVGEGGIPVASLKSWVSWLFAILHSLEEPFVGFFQAEQHILEDMGGNVEVLWPDHFFDFHQIALLLVDGDGVLFGEVLA